MGIESRAARRAVAHARDRGRHAASRWRPRTRRSRTTGSTASPFAVAKVVDAGRRALPAQAGVQAGRLAGDRPPGDRDDAGRRLRAVPAPRPRSGRGRWPARPGRRRTTRTRGSSGSPARYRRRCGWGSPGRRTRSRSTSAGRSSAARSPRRSGTTTCCRSWPGCRPRASPAPPAPEYGTVPDVLGLKSERAQNALAEANFTPLVEKVASAEPKGVVITQTPGGGASAELGRSVTIEVSSGVPAKVKVPDVVGMSRPTRRSALEAAPGSSWTSSSRHVSDPGQRRPRAGAGPDGRNQAAARDDGHDRRSGTDRGAERRARIRNPVPVRPDREPAERSSARR